MIPQSNKFPLRSEFVAFRTRAKRIVTPHTTMYVLPSSSHPRMGVVVPKKLSKLATTRNWLKRLTYDTLYLAIKNHNIDCVVVYKPLPLKKSLNSKAQITHELLQITTNR